MLIIERALDAAHGHEHTQIRAIKNLVPTARLEVITHRRVDECAVWNDGRLHPVLATRRDLRTDAEDWLKRDTEAILKVVDVRASTMPSILLVPTCNAYEIRLILAVAERCKTKLRAALRIIRPEAILPLSQDERNQLRMLQKCGVVSLHTETRELTAKLRIDFDLVAADDFLLPCSIDPNDTHIIEKSTDSSRNVYRVGYLGKNHPDKGSKQLPGILGALVKLRPRIAGDIRIEVALQRPLNRFRDWAQMSYVYQLNRALRSQSTVRLCWQKPGMPPSAFRELIATLDVVLVPYQAEVYRFCGSGVISDSVSAGLPIVNSKGIGMQSLLAHGNAFEADAPEDFAAGILEAIGRGQTLSDNLEAAQRVFIAELERTRCMLMDLNN